VDDFANDAGRESCWFVLGVQGNFVAFMSLLRGVGKFIVSGVGMRGDGLGNYTEGGQYLRVGIGSEFGLYA
jgi:hypothetical protein